MTAREAAPEKAVAFQRPEVGGSGWDGSLGGSGSERPVPGVETEIHYRRFDGPAEQIQELVLPMCVSSFVDFDPDYLCSRLPLVGGIRLWLASVGEELIGFKLGYEREPRLFYSWLGAVHADFRARGVASRLIKRQHDELVEGGMRFVETRTRADNTAMIIVNLKNGFRIVGFEVDTAGRSIVWQRKTLGEALAPATTES